MQFPLKLIIIGFLLASLTNSAQCAAAEDDHRAEVEAIAAATYGFASTDEGSLLLAQALLVQLITKDQGIPDAIRTATRYGLKCINFEGSTPKVNALRYRYALGIFVKLVEKGLGLSEALNAARFEKPTAPSLDMRVRLFVALVAQTKALDFREACDYASEAASTDDEDVCHGALELFAALLQKGIGIDEAQKLLSQESIASFVKAELANLIERYRSVREARLANLRSEILSLKTKVASHS